VRANEAAAEKLRAFTEERRVKVLNVAGPQASNEPGVGEFVRRTLDKALLIPVGEGGEAPLP
jgi:hypothetical protein